MSAKCVICLLFMWYSHVYSRENLPEVETPLGKIRGTWQTTSTGRTYAAFYGVPYAKPPIGELRFEEPKPVEPWPGVWVATTPYTCIQYFVIDDSVKGNEDCLYLNVFVPTEEISSQNNFDVLMFIHAGAFTFGSGHGMAEANVLMERDIIAVSINYRLGVLGFLSTEDDELPGNYGMKDQVLALKWIKENIGSFGGNPDSVTVSGVSAGGVSVHFHYFSPLSKGLFARGLSQSGTALDPWAIKEQPLENARRVAVLAGCDDSSTVEIKLCLKKRPAFLLTDTVKNFYGYKPLPMTAFGPVVDTYSRNPFLPINPYLAFKENTLLDVPWIVATNTDEGYAAVAFFYSNLEEVDSKWPKIAQYLLDTNYTVPVSRREDVAQQVKDFYLGAGEQITKSNFRRFSQIFTDRLFTIGAETSAKLQSKINQSPVYYHLFNYRGEHSISTLFTNGVEIEGVSHGDDGIYFYGPYSSTDLSETDQSIRNVCLDLLYTYMRNGKPSFDGTDKWQPTGESQLTYLNISHPEDIKLQITKSLTPIKFWKKLGISEYDNLVIKDEL